MNVLSRFFRAQKDPREAMRPLWHETVRVSRAPEWYREGGVADSVDGRTDMIMAVLALVMLRMETSAQLSPRTALITEIFVEDMDRQLREKGVGDLMVGKNIGKLVSALGGRMGALRKAFASDADDEALADALSRNVTLRNAPVRPALVAQTRALQAQLAARPDAALLAGNIHG